MHPAVAEAHEARVPLIVLTADRPPELRGRGAGQTIDQLKLFGDAVRWFCELGVAAADDTGLLHYRSAGVRAVAEARGRPPGPVHLNVPLHGAARPGSRRRRRDGRPSRSRARAARRRGRSRRCRAAARARRPRLVSALARLIDERPRGRDPRGPHSATPALAAAATASLARACGYPVLAEPTSQLRCGVHDLEQRDRLLRPDLPRRCRSVSRPTS